MNPHYPHPYDPKNKGVILRQWKEERSTKCPAPNYQGNEKRYIGTFLEYTYVNKKNKKVHVPEYCLLVEWV